MQTSEHNTSQNLERGKQQLKQKERARDIELQKAKLNLANQMEQARKQEALPKVEVEDPDAYLLE
jgi:hypothetical protein